MSAEVVAADLLSCRTAAIPASSAATSRASSTAEHDAAVTLSRRHGTLHARFAPADQPRTLLVSEMFRPEWTARAGRRSLTVAAAWEGLIAVSVPAGIAEVELRYRPRLVMALTALSCVRARQRGAHACRAKRAWDPLAPEDLRGGFHEGHDPRGWLAAWARSVSHIVTNTVRTEGLVSVAAAPAMMELTDVRLLTRRWLGGGSA